MALEYRPPADVVQQWDQAIRQVAQSIREDLGRATLFSSLGEPWEDAGGRYVVLTFPQAMKRIAANSNYETRWSSNPRLEYLYMNQSQLLNIRHQHFECHFHVNSKRLPVKSAFRKAVQRIGRKLAMDQEHEVYRLLDNIFSRLAWERLHNDAIQEPFHELEFRVLLAGHLPAGVEGKDWRTGKILYC